MKIISMKESIGKAISDIKQCQELIAIHFTDSALILRAEQKENETLVIEELKESTIEYYYKNARFILEEIGILDNDEVRRKILEAKNITILQMRSFLAHEEKEYEKILKEMG